MPSYDCFRAISGWIGACWTATAAIEAIAAGWLTVSNGGVSAGAAAASIPVILILAPAIWVLICLLTGIPSAMIVWISERFRIRSLLFYSCAGGVIGALSQTLVFRTFAPFGWLFVFAGILAGLDYWFVAGKHSGR